MKFSEISISYVLGRVRHLLEGSDAPEFHAMVQEATVGAAHAEVRWTRDGKRWLLEIVAFVAQGADRDAALRRSCRMEASWDDLPEWMRARILQRGEQAGRMSIAMSESEELQ